MPTVPQIIQMRRRGRISEQRRPAEKFGLGCSTLLSLGMVILGILLAFVYANLSQNLPSIERLPILLEPPGGLLLQPTRLYDQSGEHILLALENPLIADHQYLHISSTPEESALIPSTLISATLAASDPNFWGHAGFSLSGILQNSHPTLAQRLVSDLLLLDEPPSLRRALRERLLAAQITARFGRPQILEWYLNSANYGRLAYGADAAARLYFDKPASQLTLAEAAMLSAAAEAPDLNPQDAPQEALARQKNVIQNMLRYRLISPEAGVQAAREESITRLSLNPGQGMALNELSINLTPAFASLVLQQLETQIPRARLERGGLTIITTLDYDLQQQTACAAAAQAARLQNISPVILSPWYSTYGKESDCAAALLLPTLPDHASLSTGSPQVNVLVLEPASGRVLALVGDSAALPAFGPDTAVLSHPAGTLSAPFLYLTAFTRGLSPASLLWDLPPETEGAAVQNFDSQYHGPLRLRLVLANDYLAPAQSVIDQVGIENIWRTAQQLGVIPAEATPAQDATLLSLFEEVDLLDAGQAFGVLANQGVMSGHALQTTAAANRWTTGKTAQPPDLHPVTILRIEEAGGDRGSVLDWSISQTRPILTPQLAYLMTHVLSDETARWPSLGHPNALEIGRPAAAKIGRTADGESNWVFGYTPQRVVGVWIGMDSPESISAATSSAASSGLANVSLPLLAQASAGLWHAAMQYASRDLPYQSWNIPSGISSLAVCDPSGMLPTEDCPNVVEEVFLPGAEPVQVDTLYRAMPINHESGRLATVFTPTDLVDNKVYFIAPPEAEKWARQAGYAMPPETYDVVSADQPVLPEAAITSPAMFAAVRGQVPITGSAGGEAFSFYRIQVGQGLNPQAWLLVGQDMGKPAADTQLGVWDTTGLDGLYAIQLLVVQQDQSLRRATVLVSVDNRPPEIEIIYPTAQEKIEIDTRPSVVLQVEAKDNLNIASVTLYMDGKLFTQFVQPPFAISWSLKPGTHTLRAVAADQAGNTSETSVKFVVE